MIELDSIKSSISTMFAPKSTDSSAAPERPTRPKLPAPEIKNQTWEALTTEEGDVYYHNTATGETTWERPAGFQEPESQRVGLPKGWEEFTSDQGEVYYHNHETQETCWQRPSFEEL